MPMSLKQRLTNRGRWFVALLGLLGVMATTSAGCNYAIGDSITLSSKEEIQREFNNMRWPGTVIAENGKRIDWIGLVTAGVVNDIPTLQRIFFNGGTNDAFAYHWDPNFPLQDSVTGLQSTVRYVVDHRPRACLFLVTIKEPTFGPYDGQRFEDAARYLNEIMRQLDVSYGQVHRIDWSALSANYPGWFIADGIHPNLFGQNELAEYYTDIGGPYQCGP